MKYIPTLIILLLFSCKDFEQSPKTISENDTLSYIKPLPIKIGQSPIHEKLSKQFNYQSFIKRIPTEYSDSCIVKIVITNKENNAIIDTVNLISRDLQNDSIFIDKNVRSYLTGTNVDKEIIDNDYGYLVVADFNFDGLDDFAITRNYGVSSGPFYNFYIQSSQNKFELDKYLSETVIWFPNEINKHNKTLTTLVMETYTSVCETTYKYNSTSKKWVESKKQYFGEND